MAKDTKDRSALTAKSRATRGEEELRLWCTQGTRNQLKDLMEWTADTQLAWVMTLAIGHIHSLGPEAAREGLNPPHNLTIKESWREKFENETRRKLFRYPGDEIQAPR